MKGALGSPEIESNLCTISSSMGEAGGLGGPLGRAVTWEDARLVTASSQHLCKLAGCVFPPQPQFPHRQLWWLEKVTLNTPPVATFSDSISVAGTEGEDLVLLKISED